MMLSWLLGSTEREKTQGRPRSPLWRAARRAHLLREPTCQACGTTDSLQVHHVVPFWLDPSQELEPTNLITLCEPAGEGCHYLFGHLRRWTASNPHVREDAARYWMRVIAYRR